MPSSDNLVPIGSSERAAEIGRKGGRASGKARRARRSMREAAQAVLSGRASDTYGLEETFTAKELKGISLQDAVILRQVQKAVEGSTAAAAFLRDTAGESPRASAPASAPISIGNIQMLNIQERHIVILSKLSEYMMETGQVRAFWKWAGNSTDSKPVIDPSAIGKGIDALCDKVDKIADQPPSIEDMDNATINELATSYLGYLVDYLEGEGLLPDAAAYIDSRRAEHTGGYSMPIAVTGETIELLDAVCRIHDSGDGNRDGMNMIRED